MLCQVYRSERKAETYLYVEFNRGLDTLPETLRSQLGELAQVMVVNLAKRKKLANADIEKVKIALVQQGFYLQLPPGPDAFLKKGLNKAN